MKNYFLLLALGAAFTFSACDNDDDDASTPSQTRTQMLTSKTWQISARSQVYTDSAGNSTTDTSLDNCEKDDTYKFTTDNKINFDEGATKCDPDDPQTGTGTWAFSSNETKLDLTVSGIPISGDIIELTPNRMILKSTIDIFGEEIVNTSTFTAQ